MSKFGSGMFLLVQVVLLLDFVHRWNDTWVGYDEQFWSVLGFAILFYLCNMVSFICYYIFLIFYGISLSVSNCFVVVTGMLLYLLFHLSVTWELWCSRVFSFTSSRHLDKTVEPISFSFQ